MGFLDKYKTKSGSAAKVVPFRPPPKQKPPPKSREQRLIGAPLAFVAAVCRATTGRAALLVAQLIYRRTVVCGSRTVTLPGDELVELGVSREMKRKALAQLAEANLIRTGRTLSGQSAKVTLLWKPK